MMIRPARIEDAAGIATAHVRGWQEAYRDIYSADYLQSLSIEKRTENWIEWIGNAIAGKSATLIAELNYAVVGFINVGDYRHEGAQPDEGEVNALYVSPEFKGKGIGSALLNQGFDWLRERKKDSAYVETAKLNPYKRFYEKNGGTLQPGVVSRESGGRTIEIVCYKWEF